MSEFIVNMVGYSYTNPKFVEMRDAMNKHFDDNMKMYPLFKLDCDTEELWDVYLDAFPEFIKQPWRERAWHDCQACKRWFRKMANVIAMPSSDTIVTLFDCEVPIEYAEAFKQLRDYLMEHNQIKDILCSSEQNIGHKQNFEEYEGKVIQHDHFFTVLPKNVIEKGVKVGQRMAKIKTNKMVLESSLQTFTPESIEDVLDLINENNLYRGEEAKFRLETIKKLQNEYNTLQEDWKNNWCWYQAYKQQESVCRLKNSVIGALLLNLSGGMDLETAVGKYEAMVAPTNYKRPKAIFTRTMLDNAKEKIVELGYNDSLRRRYAVMEDLSVKDTLFANRDLTKGIKTDDLFEQLEEDVVEKPKTFHNVQKMTIKDFVELLPKASDVSIYVNDDHIGNFVSLLAPINKDAPSMFKWNNPYSWAYKNNIADSMKEQVKAMGGDVDVDLRFSIRWNNRGEYDGNDLDAHCLTAQGNRIFFNNKKDARTGGWLDVDIIDPKRDTPAVENIQFKDKHHMPVGDYYFGVHQYTYRGGDNGFEAEIEFDNKIYNFNYPHKVKQDEFIDVACVTLDGHGKFTLTPKDRSMMQIQSKVWNIKMNDFAPVTLVCYSPNYWDSETGHQHIFFMLKDCVSDETPNAWYNEYLNNELNENRKVMEALASKAKVELTENQLSGLGFSLTRHDSFIAKITIQGVENTYEVEI